MRGLVSVALIVGGCTFAVPALPGLDLAAPVEDGGPPVDLVADFTGADLAGLDLPPPPDLSLLDLVAPPDLVSSPDLVPSLDLTMNPVALDALQTGTCTIADLATSVSCPIPNAVVAVETILVFQASSPADNPANALIRCHLTSSTAIACDRDGTAGAVGIRWQTASFRRGVRVQHLTPPCTGNATDVTFTAVDPARTFLLFSMRKDGAAIEADDFRTAELVNATTARITADAGCVASQFSLQVVEVQGANVTRGFTGAIPAAIATAGVVNLAPVALNRTFLLYSYRTSAGGVEMCERMIRGELASNTALSFRRGDGANGCTAEALTEVSWERVELPAGFNVQQVTQAMADGTASATTTITTVNAVRTLVFAGGQWATGQGIGEGSNSTATLFGSMFATHRLMSPVILELTRASTTGSARFTSFVVEMPIN